MKERDIRNRLRAYIADEKCARVFLVLPAYGVFPVGWIALKDEGKISDGEIEQFYYDNMSEIEKQKYLFMETAIKKSLCF